MHDRIFWPTKGHQSLKATFLTLCLKWADLIAWGTRPLNWTNRLLMNEFHYAYVKFQMHFFTFLSFLALLLHKSLRPLILVWHQAELRRIWAEIEKKLSRNWAKIEQKLSKNWAETEQKLSKNWAENEQKMSKNWAKTEQNLSRNWSETV